MLFASRVTVHNLYIPCQIHIVIFIERHTSETHIIITGNTVIY